MVSADFLKTIICCVSLAFKLHEATKNEGTMNATPKLFAKTHATYFSATVTTDENIKMPVMKVKH